MTQPAPEPAQQEARPATRGPVGSAPSWAARTALLAFGGALLVIVVWRAQAGSSPDAPLALSEVARRGDVIAWARALGMRVAASAAAFTLLGLLAIRAFPFDGARGVVWRSVRALGCVGACVGFGVMLRAIEDRMPGMLGVAPFLGGSLLGVVAGLPGPRRSLPGAVGRLVVIGLAGVVAVAGGAWLSLSEAPLSFEPVAVTSEHKRELVALVRTHDPRKLGPGDQGSVVLTEAHVNRLLAWGLGIGAGTRVRRAHADLQPGRVLVEASLELPRVTFGRRYVNVFVGLTVEPVPPGEEADAVAGPVVVRADALRVGSVGVASFFVRALSRVAYNALARDAAVRPILAAVRSVALGEHEVGVTYAAVDVPKDFFAKNLARVLPHGEEDTRTRLYVQRLTDLARLAPAGGALKPCFEAAFSLAAERSRAADGGGEVGDPVAENRAAVLALAVVMGHARLARLVGDVWQPGMSAEVWSWWETGKLGGRRDWARHFLVSAALTLISTEAASAAAGLLKEELDARQGGSGFSFGDLIADHAGVVFAGVATRDAASARTLQQRIAAGFVESDFFPQGDDLAEGLRDPDLVKDYDGIGGARYQAVQDEIERRVASCPGYGLAAPAPAAP